MAAMRVAEGLVLALALILVLAVANTSSLLDRRRWFLLLLALVAGILAGLRRQGAL